MSNTPESPLVALLNTLKRHAALAAFAGLAVFAVVVSFTRGLPNLYRASASILVEDAEVGGEQSEMGVLDSRLQSIKQEALSRARLTELIERFDLYRDMRQQGSITSAIGRVQKDIQIEVTSTSRRRGEASTLAFKLSYVGSDPATVAAVTNTLASFYVTRNDALRTRPVTERTQFLKDSLADAKKKLDEQEQRVAAFTTRNVSRMPQQLDSDHAALGRINIDLQTNANEQIRLRAYRQTLLYQVFDVRNAPPVKQSDPERDLANLRKELAELRLKQTENSPDVRTKEREIRSLVERIAATGGTQAHEEPSRLNALEDELANTDKQLQTLTTDYDTLRKSAATYQTRIESAPVGNTEFEAIMYDRRATRELYDSLQKRYDEAVIAERAEQGQEREQFRILDQALPPTDPAAPDRIQLLVAGLFFAVCFGAGVAFAVDQLDTSFHSLDDLRAFTQVPVLATIPKIVTTRDVWRKAWASCGLAVVGLVLIVFVGRSAFHYAQGSDWVTRMLLSRG